MTERFHYGALGRFSVLIFMLAVAGCKDDMEAHYTSSADAIKDGAFQRGWLPDVLREGATDIKESHDLDSNKGEATFRYTGNLAQRLDVGCVRLALDENMQRRFRSRLTTRYKKDDSLESQHNIRPYQCATFTVVVDPSHQVGYVWH